MTQLFSYLATLICTGPQMIPGARFSKASEAFRARKAIFSSSVSKNGEVYKPKTSCMKGTCVHVKNTWIKQLCNHKVRDAAMASRLRKIFGTFEKRAPGPQMIPKLDCKWSKWLWSTTRRFFTMTLIKWRHDDTQILVVIAYFHFFIILRVVVFHRCFFLFFEGRR